MYSYKDLGLVNMRAMLKKAYEEKYAVPALNFISIEQFNAIVDAVIAKRSPVILLVSPNLHRQLGFEMLARVAQSGVDRLKNADLACPMALHLDHGMTYEHCVMAIENGFSSVMIDGSALPLSENIELTCRVVEYAHKYDVSVEGELGTLSGVEEHGPEADDRASLFTDPLTARTYVQKTNVDCLAISIGTSHGLVKVRPRPDGTIPPLRYDILSEVEKMLPEFPIVLHGASTIMQTYIDMINQFGGKIENASGIPEEQIAKASRMAVCKVNIASDGWISALALTRKYLAENPGAIDSRVFTLKVRPELADLYMHKIDVLGSANKI